MQINATVSVLVVCTATMIACSDSESCFGSLRRFEITKANQSDSPIKFSVKITPNRNESESVQVEILLPGGQEELVEIWKVYLWISQDKKITLSVPLEVTYDEQKSIAIRFSGHVDTVRRSLVAIRCGRHAPVSETIYQIDLASFLREK